MVRTRVRIRFSKHGLLRWLGHRDLVRVWERLFRRAGVCLRQSTGFHPRPKLSFPSALSLGVTGTDEVLELELDEARPANDLAVALEPHLPAGLSVHGIDLLPPGSKPAQVCRVVFVLPIPPDRAPRLADRIQHVLAQPACLVERDAGRPAVDWRPQVLDLRLEQGSLRIELNVARQGSVRPRELLAALELDDLESQGFQLTRTRVELEA